MLDATTKDLLSVIYNLSLCVLGDAPDESECTYEENDAYAELANFVNVYPDLCIDPDERSELSISAKTGSHLYFKTNAETAQEAYESFQIICRAANLETTHLRVEEALLRDEDREEVNKVFPS